MQCPRASCVTSAQKLALSLNFPEIYIYFKHSTSYPEDNLVIEQIMLQVLLLILLSCRKYPDCTVNNEESAFKKVEMLCIILQILFLNLVSHQLEWKLSSNYIFCNLLQFHEKADQFLHFFSDFYSAS